MKKNLTIILFFLTLSGIALFLLGPNSSTVLAATASGQVFQTDTCPVQPGTSPHHSFTIRLPWSIPSGSTCPPTGCNGYTDTLSNADTGAFTLTVPSGVTPGSQISIVGEPGWQFPCVTNQPVSSSVVFGVKPISTSGGSGLTGTNLYPDLIVDNLSPANGSPLINGTITFSGVVKNIAQTPQTGNPPVAGPSQALLFINYNIDTTLDYPSSSFIPLDLTLTPDPSQYPYFRSVIRMGPGGNQTVSWSSLPNPPGIHGYAICANMHVNPSGARDVVESNYNDNCTFGWYYNPTFTLNTPATSCQQGLTIPKVDLSWGVSAAAQYYTVLRRLNAQSPWENIGTLLAQILGTPITVYADWNPQNSTQYDYQILASNIFGATLSDIKSVTTPSCNNPLTIPPTITFVRIDQGSTSTSFSGAARTSGLLSDESGSNWKNSIFVTLNASPTAPSTTPIKEYYVTFQNGPKLAYTASPDSNTICGSTANYCVYDNGWQSIPVIGYRVPPSCTGGEDCMYIISKTGTPAKWEVFFHKNFGSKNMSISGYVKDANGLCSNNTCQDSDLNGLQQP